MANADVIVQYLRENQPRAFCDDCISNHLNIRPRQQIYQICTRLFHEGRVNRTESQCAMCHGCKKATSFGAGDTTPGPEIARMVATVHEGGRPPMGWKEFEVMARDKMSEFYKAPLLERQLMGYPKRFDMVSEDGGVIGDAKFLSLVHGVGVPPAKYMEIAGHVWLLERVTTNRRFLVFGNQREVPEGWLKKYGKLVTNVEFYFLHSDGRLERLL